MIFNMFDVVVVPFPFTDRSTTKRRPALVLSDAENFNKQVGQSVLAMITSAQNFDWPLDVEIADLDAAGLTSASVVRMKLFTLDDRSRQLNTPCRMRPSTSTTSLVPASVSSRSIGF